MLNRYRLAPTTLRADHRRRAVRLARPVRPASASAQGAISALESLRSRRRMRQGLRRGLQLSAVAEWRPRRAVQRIDKAKKLRQWTSSDSSRCSAPPWSRLNVGGSRSTTHVAAITSGVAPAQAENHRWQHSARSRLEVRHVLPLRHWRAFGSVRRPFPASRRGGLRKQRLAM